MYNIVANYNIKRRLIEVYISLSSYVLMYTFKFAKVFFFGNARTIDLRLNSFISRLVTEVHYQCFLIAIITLKRERL